jgi:tetratricopeptide (TPR) repeat protein
MPEADTLYQHYPDLKRLRKSLQRAGEKFALFFVECNLPILRDELAETLSQEMATVRVDLSLLPAETQSLDELIARQVKDTAGPIFLFGLEQWLPSLSEDKLLSTVQQLNWRRNRYAALQRPLVIWLPRYALDILAEHTPDFYDWYSGVFVFQASTELQTQAEGISLQTINSISGIHAADRLSQEEKKRWQHTLKELLQEHTEDDSGRANLLGNLAYLMDSMGDYAQALGYFQQALAIHQKTGYKRGEGATLNNISQIFQTRGDYNTALTHLQQSIIILRQIGDKKGEGVTLNNISLIYSASGNYETALEYLQQALTIQQQIGDKNGEGVTLSNMATIAHVYGDYTTAQKHVNQALSIFQKIGDKRSEGRTFNTLSQIYHARGEYVEALPYLQQALVIQQQIGDKTGEGATLNNISQIYDARGDYDTALVYLKKSLVIQQQIGDKAGLCSTLFNMAHIHWQNNELDEAMRLWVEVYNIAKPRKLAQALDALEKLAEKLGLTGELDAWEKLAQQMKKQAAPT